MADAIAATRPTLAALKCALEDAQQDRRNAFMWSDFAMTNGTIDRIDNRIYWLKEQIAEREKVPT